MKKTAFLLLMTLFLFACQKDNGTAVSTEEVPTGITVSVPAASITARSATYWSGAHSTVLGARNVSIVIDKMLELIKASKIKPGSTASYVRLNQNRKVKFSRMDSDYKYLLEVWGEKTDGSYEKGLEFRFDNSQRGEIVLRPWAFNETYIGPEQDNSYIGDQSGYLSDYYWKVRYEHTNNQNRYMEIDLDGPRSGTDNSSYGKGRYKVKLTGQEVSIYYAGVYTGAINGIWIFGSLINTSSIKGVAKYGSHNSGDSSPYSFYYDPGTGSDINSVQFDSGGYLNQGYTGGDSTFPDPNNITVDNLTSEADLQAINLGFSDPSGPGF
jgi:hypothetical protein